MAKKKDIEKGITDKDVEHAIRELCKPRKVDHTKQVMHPQLYQAMKEYVESQQKLNNGKR